MKRSNSPVWRAMLSALIAMAVSACGVLPGKSSQQPTRDYSLNAGLSAGAVDPGVAPGNSCVSAQVMLPRTAPGFNTSRMAYTYEPDSLRYFAFSQWLDTPAYMMQPLLVRALHRSGVFQHVVKSPSPVRTRFRLEADDLAVIQQINGQTNVVRIALRLRLLDIRDGALIIDEPVVLERRATGADPRSGVTTANELARELIELVAESVRAGIRVEDFCPG